MKLLLKKSLLIFIPALIYVAFITITDPFNFFRISKFIGDDVKHDISLRINYGLWKVLRLNENITTDIILGDSRMEDMDVQQLNNKTERKFYNFSFAGATPREIVSAFNLIKDNNIIKNIYIGVCFDYNIEKTKDRITGALDIINNPLLYFTNLDVLKSAYSCLRYRNNMSDYKKTPVLEQDGFKDLPVTENDEFWKSVIDDTELRLSIRYNYPGKYINDLEYISSECKVKNKKLYFIFTPSHEDYHHILSHYKLDTAYYNFKQKISKLPAERFIDLDNDEILSSNKENFIDILHLKKYLRTELFIKKVLNQ